MTAFADYFWGEKNNGFDVLYHNMKYGLDSSKEYTDFLRESCSVEENYVKLQLKLATKIATSYGSKGSFGPYWVILRTCIEKLANIHQQLMISWQEQFKEVQKYTIEQQKIHKEVKDHESTTIETVQCIQQTIVLMQKAKESYHARCIEFEKLKRDNASSKDLEKVEAKFKKANDDYRAFVDKYANIRNDFEVKMTEACKRFQEVEENHLQQMRVFVDLYITSWKQYHTCLGQVHDELTSSSNELTVNKLIDTMVQQKTTGTDRPGPIELEDADFSMLPPPVSTPDLDRRDTPVPDKTKKDGAAQRFPMLLDTANHVSELLIKRRKKKKKIEKDNKDTSDAADIEANTSQLDKDGFTIKPVDNSCEHDSSCSSFDSDSDTDSRKAKIAFTIKPFSPSETQTTSDNVDNIRSLVRGLQITGTPTRRTPVADTSYSTSTLNSKPSQDLWDLEIFNNSPLTISSPVNGRSSACRRRNSPATGWSECSFNSVDNTVQPARPNTGTPTSSVSVTSGMQSQRPGAVTAPLSHTRSTAWQSLSDVSGAMDRVESNHSLTQTPFNTSMSFGSSRGPSPLSVSGLTSSDVVPLAFAFSETVHAYFSGGIESNCKVRLTGEMVVSLPSGVIPLLKNNPSCGALSVRVKNIANLDEVLFNKQLVTENVMDNTQECRVYNFDVPALVQHLEHQSELNHQASYFNIDVLKYKVNLRQPNFMSTPLHLRSFWKYDCLKADFRLEYSYNGSAMSSPMALSNVVVHVPVNGDVTKMQCKPPGTWSVEKKRAIWNVGTISEVAENGSQGSVRAKFDLSSPPSGPYLAAMQFVGEGTTFSGIDFELLGGGYRTCLVKKRITSGKYISEAAVV